CCLYDLHDSLLPYEIYLIVGERRTHDGVRHKLEQYVEIAAQRLRAEGRRVRSDIEARGGADAVERVGPRLRIARGGATQHRLRAEAADAGTACWFEPLARLDGQEDGSGKKPGYRDNGDTQAVLEAMPADVHYEASGTNQPTTRPFSRNTDSEAARTSSAVTAASRSYHSPSDEAACVARSWPKRMARQVTVSVMNALAESICLLARPNSSSVRADRAILSSSSRMTRSTRSWVTSGCICASTTKRYGSFMSWNDASTVVASPVSTSARYRRDDRPDAASPPPAVAPPRATARRDSAAARGSAARGALWPIWMIGSAPPARRTMTRRSPYCGGSGALGGSIGASASSGPNAAAARSSSSLAGASPAT